VPVGLDKQESDVEPEAGDRHEGELNGRIEGTRRGYDIVRKHQDQYCHRDQHREEGVGALDPELGLALSEGAHDDAKAGQPVQHQHDNGMHRVPQQRRVRLAAQHHRDDEPDFDDRHGKRKNQGAEWLSHPECDDFGVMHGGDHIPQQHSGDHDRKQLEAHLADNQPCCDAQHRQDDGVERNPIGWSAGHAEFYGPCADDSIVRRDRIPISPLISGLFFFA
jgi:hypothetical protein